MMNGMNQAWGMGLGWVIGLLVLVVLSWLIVKAVNQSKDQDQLNSNSPLDVLKKRYARGKIGKKEFEKKRIDIS
jgi:putative membrane protein